MIYKEIQRVREVVAAILANQRSPGKRQKANLLARPGWRGMHIQTNTSHRFSSHGHISSVPSSSDTSGETGVDRACIEAHIHKTKHSNKIINIIQNSGNKSLPLSAIQHLGHKISKVVMRITTCAVLDSPIATDSRTKW